MADTGWLGPSTVVNATGIGTVAWSNPGNATTQDALYASATGNNVTTNYLKGTGYGATVPLGTTIDGIEVKVRNYASESAWHEDPGVNLVISDTVVGAITFGSTAPWTIVEQDTIYGSATNLWGQTLTPSIVNASTFGATLSALVAGNRIAYVNLIAVKIYYTANATNTSSMFLVM